MYQQVIYDEGQLKVTIFAITALILLGKKEGGMLGSSSDGIEKGKEVQGGRIQR